MDRFLRIDTHDPGCEELAGVLHVYADLVLAGESPDERYPGIALHVRSCGACAEELDGLVGAARGLLNNDELGKITREQIGALRPSGRQTS